MGNSGRQKPLETRRRRLGDTEMGIKEIRWRLGLDRSGSG